MDMFTHRKFRFPNGSATILTSRPDSYDEDEVYKFIDEFRPIVRFQMTDDRMKKERAINIPYHWLTWFPGRKLPVEVAYLCISLLNSYIKTPGSVLWLHCDSSTMRAPTFLGLYLMCYHKDTLEDIINQSKSSSSYRNKSCPKYYAETSIVLDPGIKELILNWQEGGEEQAHNYLANLRN